ncbi:MAG: CBS domain-containing protein [Caldilineaceae bacterium]
MMHRIPIQKIMTHEVITIHPEALVTEAAGIMDDLELRRMPVIDEDGCLLGIVTDSDIREAESVALTHNSYEPGSEPEWLTIADIMTRDVVTISSDATVGQLAELFIEHKIGGVPVIENTPDTIHPKLIGIVTETDIFEMIAEAWENEKLESRA